ncbi:MAG TPA: hypothetical protein VFL91_14980 [Thermomicrobiales bacterium]|nr:hypothetical protein [Thermomicrobiales bacterium]
MAIAFLFELPDMSPEQSAAIIREMDLGGKPPAGQILHIEGPMEGGGTRGVDVWESREALEEFVRERLGPIAQRMGIALPEPTVWPVTPILK